MTASTTSWTPGSLRRAAVYAARVRRGNSVARPPARIEKRTWELSPCSLASLSRSFPRQARGAATLLVADLQSAARDRSSKRRRFPARSVVGDAARVRRPATYGELFGGIESRWSLGDLNTVIEFAQRDAITPAPPDAFIESLWIDNDWGRPSNTLVGKWRATE